MHILKLSLFFILSALFTGCSGVTHDYHSATGLYQEHAYDNSVIGPNTKLSLYYRCEKGQFQDSKYGVFKIPKNCTPIDQRFSSSAGVLPALAGATATLGAAGILSSADWGTNIEQNTNNSTPPGHNHGHGKPAK